MSLCTVDLRRTDYCHKAEVTGEQGKGEGFEPRFNPDSNSGAGSEKEGQISTSVQPQFNPSSTQVQPRFNPGSTQIQPYSNPGSTWVRNAGRIQYGRSRIYQPYWAPRSEPEHARSTSSCPLELPGLPNSASTKQNITPARGLWSQASAAKIDKFPWKFIFQISNHVHGLQKAWEWSFKYSSFTYTVSRATINKSQNRCSKCHHVKSRACAAVSLSHLSQKQSSVQTFSGPQEKLGSGN